MRLFEVTCEIEKDGQWIEDEKWTVLAHTAKQAIQRTRGRIEKWSNCRLLSVAYLHRVDIP